ncbi:hypothetical protein ARMSODRAFT_1085611 [Armillaria solidipes]|uniref:NAD(P)-binding protein n=1 Tax=Armillaria solidipes TaxID=1076256 RepID=A0A2H3BAL0_9AGAR|nr:hypothetical protein ARMSODRAFT_1085611 [Armillaria solidipes]
MLVSARSLRLRPFPICYHQSRVGSGFSCERAKEFTRMNHARLVLTARDEAKGKQALNDTGYSKVELWIIDLANFTASGPSLKRFCLYALHYFVTEADLKAGAAHDDQLIWDNTTWISGHSNVTDNPSSFSTYNVLDAYSMNTTVYPNLQATPMAAKRLSPTWLSIEDDAGCIFGSILMLADLGPMVWRRISQSTQLRMLVLLNGKASKQYNLRTISFAWGLVSVAGRVLY